MEDKLISQILNPSNMDKAKLKVVSNKGASGVDNVSIEDIDEYIKENWTRIRQEIIERRYKPQPVLRVEISKENGGVRKLGIPTVMDRIIQQAIVQVLSPIIDQTFSETSYGIRPGRSCEQAIIKSLEYLNDGFEWVVDIDLEKFFDKVPQDKLMSIIHELIQAPDMESLIRKYIKAGIMNKGEYEKSEIGAPQGGNLSPFLSNIMLDKLDKELERRGLKFTRYADDCLIFVGSKAAATRVKHSVTRYIENKLGLKVNAEKSKISRPSKIKYLGFGYWKDHKSGYLKARPHKVSVEKFWKKLKYLTTRRWPIPFEYRLKKLNEVIRGEKLRPLSMQLLSHKKVGLRTKCSIYYYNYIIRGEDFQRVLEEICKVKGHKITKIRPEKWSNAGEILADNFLLAWRVFDAQYWGSRLKKRKNLPCCRF